VEVALPEISQFFGIVVAMFYSDHPPPHFHVRYARQRAVVDIATLSMIEARCRRVPSAQSSSGPRSTGTSSGPIGSLPAGTHR
jgi:hypothetical protein